jgi:hypothetical protein
VFDGAAKSAESCLARLVSDSKLRWRYWDLQEQGPFPGTPEMWRYLQACSRPPSRGRRAVTLSGKVQVQRTAPPRLPISRIEFAAEDIVAALPGTLAMLLPTSQPTLIAKAAEITEVIARQTTQPPTDYSGTKYSPYVPGTVERRQRELDEQERQQGLPLQKRTADEQPVLSINVHDNYPSRPVKLNSRERPSQALLKAAMEEIAKGYPPETMPTPPPFDEIWGKLKERLGLPHLPRKLARQALNYVPRLKGRRGYHSRKAKSPQ